MNKRISLSIVALLLATISMNAQNKLCKIWYNQEKTSKVQVFLATDGKYYGKIVWLKDPIENGQPKTDKENSDDAKKKRPLMGLQFLSGLTKKSETEFVDGKIYDPKNGKTYDCKMTIKDDHNVDLRGYVMGMPFLGRTSNWTLAEGQ